MKFVSEFRKKEFIQPLVEKIREEVESGPKDLTHTFMEVCGTHTMSIARNGIKKLLPPAIALVSGPGCPVCVTSTGYIDKALALAEKDDVIITTFGDMMRVPGSEASLEWAKARGADVRVVLSARNALQVAEKNPEKKTVFLGIGFETTVPTVAATIRQAQRKGTENFFVFSAHKTMPVPMRSLASDPDVRVEGYICPGHVCTITGPGPFRELTEEFHIPACIAGFEPTDVLQAILELVRQRNRGEATLKNLYSRAVKEEGNPKAQKLIEEVFTAADSWWRGLGVLPGSGLAIRAEFEAHDIEKVLPVSVPESREPKGCRCGDVLKGVCSPQECPLFGKACTPERPVGACMVSQEGSCAAAYKWRGA